MSERRDYAALQYRRFGSVLEVAVISVGMVSTKGEPHRIALAMKLRTRVTCQRNGVAVERTLEYKSRPRIIEAWSQDSNRLLHEEFTLGYDTLAQYVAEVYFYFNESAVVWWD